MATGDHSVRVTATSRDEVGELARAFNPMAEELAGVDRQRRELVANVSHELRTPLAALCAAAGEPRRRRRRARPRDAARRPRPGRADDRPGRPTCSTSSRVDAGKAPLAREPSRSGRCSTAPSPRPGSAAATSPYDVQVDPPDLAVQGDPARLRQLVANLLDNASRHSPPGGTVDGAGRGDGDRWQLEVADQGPGVAPANRERAFERFGTLSDIDGGGGTGLGPRHRPLGHRPARRHHRLRRPRAGRARRPGPRRPARSHPDRSARRRRPDRASSRAASPQPRRRAAGGRHRRRAAAARPLLDDALRRLLARPRVPARRGAARRARRRACSPASCCRSATSGSARSSCCSRPAVSLLAASRHRRDPFTLDLRGRCASLLAATVVVRDAEWIVVLCLLAGAACAPCGLTRGRTRARRSCWPALAWPLAGLRGLPWLGRTLRVAHRARAAGPRCCARRVWSVLGLIVFGAAVRLRRRAVRRVGRTRCCPTSPSDTFVAAGLRRGGRRRHRAGRRPTSPSTRRAVDRGGAPPVRSRTGSSGWRRCSSSTRSSRRSWSPRPR